MKRFLILSLFVFAFGIVANAQTETIKKAEKATKDATVTGAKSTNNGVKKGWYFSKRTGKKVWIKSKSVTKKTAKVVKDAVN